MADCAPNTARELACRDGSAAAHLKLIAIAVIFFTSVIGVSAPVFLARFFHGKPLYDKATLLIKCFAAGVILSTSLVHVMPDAFAALADCHVASLHPWKDYPFAGLVTLLGALLALLVDLAASSHAELHGHGGGVPAESVYKAIDERGAHHGTKTTTKTKTKKVVVGLGLGLGSELARVKEYYRVNDEGKSDGGACEDADAATTAVDIAGETEEELLAKMKQKMVSQVLEIGIIFHSVIIGVTMGMSQNKCTIRPLVAALAFHQIFEGMGLGGCIAQAGFSFTTTAYMCFMFAVTTPLGIILGMAVFAVTGYDDNSMNALILEGLLGSLSSGILIYMALVDLISADFFHNKMMNCEKWMKKASYVALFLGSTAMSILALWA
ncbi:hypothetical protein V2J09_020725 [Rumex salicifolius]